MYQRLFAVLSFTMFLLSFLILTSVAQNKPPVIESGDPRAIGLKNAEFAIYKSERPITFRSGRAKDTEFVFEILRVAFGDMTGDGRDEAAVLVRKVSKSTKPSIDVICILNYANGPPQLSYSFVPASAGGYVLSIASLGSNFEIKNGTLFLDVAVREMNYVPKSYYTAAYKIISSSPTLVSRTPLKKLPDNMMEEG